MMRKRLKLTAITGPYYPLLLMGLVVLMVLSLSRIGLFVWQYERVVASGVTVFWLLLQGIRADLIFLGIWLLVPMLFMPIFAHKHGFKRWRYFCHGWSLLGFTLILFIEISTPQFILQYDIRPNRLYIEYLKYPQEVLSTLWHGFRAMLLGGLALTLVAIWLLNKLLVGVRHQSQAYANNRTLWLSWPFVLLLVLFSIRSTTDHRPANPAFFAITGDALVNSLVINSPYSVLYALYSFRHETRSGEIYGALDQEEMLATALDWPWLKTVTFNHPELPTLNTRPATAKRDKPLNLVIVLEESLGATFVESLGGVPVTPELEKLKHEGWWFEQLYATGTRSVRGIEAVIAGFMPTPAQSVVKLSLAQNNFYTLASSLASLGYRTSFIYGGEAHFDNMRSFFVANGFQDVVDLGQITNPVFIGSWGASDEDLFNTAHGYLREMHSRQKPFFSLVFTSSNHAPFEFPDGRIELYEQPQKTVYNAVKYADYALGKFLEQAKQQAYWHDTLFLIVADHDSRVYGNNLVPVEKFHIPGLILGADITPKRIQPVASQIDLAPTLLSLMGLSIATPLIGRDFSRDDTSEGRALMQFDQYFALLEGEELTILRPQQPAVKARYLAAQKKVVVSDEVVSERQKQRALAQVLLPSYLYREQKYRLPENLTVKEKAIQVQ